MTILKTVSRNNQKNGKMMISQQSLKIMTVSLVLSLLVGCSGNESASQPVDTEADTQAIEPTQEVVETATSTTQVETTVTGSETLQANDTDAKNADVESADTEVNGEDIEVSSESEEVSDVEEMPTVALSADAGKKRYEETCKICHDSGLLQSPKIGDKEAWAPRIAKGIDTLYKHSAEGYNQMPAQATGDISKEEVYAAVDYLVAQSS